MPIAMMRAESGTKARVANTTDLNKYVSDLQQELTKSKAETQRARDKLSCLVSLIRRSWNGDRNALLHLSNIVGMEPPGGSVDGLEGRPSTGVNGEVRMTRAEKNWERLTLRLLQMENEAIQNEIHEHQQHYLENRSRFMDEVMFHHQKDMSRFPTTNPVSIRQYTLEEVDRNFLQQHPLKKRPMLRSKSAAHAHNRKPRDVVHAAEVKLCDLFVEPSHSQLAGGDAAVANANANAPLSAALMAGEMQPLRKTHSHEAYDDSRRYLQGNLFRTEDVMTKKPRPISAALLRERDALRARPRSASIAGAKTEGSAFMTQVEGQSLRNEVVQPAAVPTRMPARKSGTDKAPEEAHVTFASPLISENFATEHAPPSSPDLVLPKETVDDILAAAKTLPSISLQMKNALKRPESMDKLGHDLSKMHDMELVFQKGTKALQRKLGLPEEGFV